MFTFETFSRRMQNCVVTPRVLTINLYGFGASLIWRVNFNSSPLQGYYNVATGSKKECQKKRGN